MKNKPRAESDTAVFQPDEWLHLLPQKNEHHAEEGELFGLVLVAHWPPNNSIIRPYIEFLQQMKGWFNQEDYMLRGEHNIPAVYLYPPSALHITIATFARFDAPSPGNRAEYANACKNIAEKAFSRKDWPNRPFQIEIDKVNIGVKAGILLWENEDGVIKIMRKILQEEYNAFYELNPGALDNRETLTVPEIIHTTFMRFGHECKSNRTHIQKRFEEVSKDTKDCFGKIEVNSVKLAVERIPYMHIPCNERHVLTSFDATSKEGMHR